MEDKHRWSKSERLREERRKRAEANRPQPLELPYPWRCVPFDVLAFGKPVK